MSARTVTSNVICATCSTPLPRCAPAGHCPACLWRISFVESEDEAPESEPWNVLGDHELFEEIGRGGMGIIYRARQRRLRRTVAVKVLRGAEFAGEEARARFRIEAEAAARLQHPGIVAIHDVGEEDGVLWFSMDYVPGENLDQRVREHPLPAREAASLVAHIADALQHAHDHGVLHRDLKPSNILLADGQPRITDFGLARREATDASAVSDRLTRAGEALGSPGYSAPEQALEGRADARTDVYGLGALLYHLLTGRPPFQGPTLDSILLQLRETEPLAPRRLNPTVPRDLETIALHCLSKSPAARYSTAHEMADDLERFLRSETIRARPANAFKKATRWCRRYPAVAALLALLLSGAVTAFVILENARHREARAANMAEAANTKLGQSNLRLNEAAAVAELRLADELFAVGDSGGAVGALARVLRREPAHPVAGPRLASALWHGDFALPKLMPFIATARVRYLHVLADGKTLLVCADDGAAFWDTATDQQTRKLATSYSIYNYCLSSDEKTLAGWSSSEQGSLLSLWDMDSGQLIAPPIPIESWQHQVVFSPDGNTILRTGVEMTVRLLDARTGAVTGEPLQLPFHSFAGAFSPDGKLLAMSVGHHAFIWEAATRTFLRAKNLMMGDLRFLRFSANSEWLLAGNMTGRMRCHRVSDGEPIGLEMQHGDYITSVALSADITRAISFSNDNTARVWALPGGEPITPPLHHGDNVNFAAFSPDERRVVTCSVDNTARLWDAQTGRSLSQPLRHTEQVSAAAFSPDGETLYTSGSDRIIQRWDIRRRNSTPDILAHGARIGGAEWSSDGRIVASNGADQRTVVRDARTLEPLLEFTHTSAQRLLRLSPDGTVLLCCGNGGVRVLRCGGDGMEGIVGNRFSPTQSVAFSPDGRRFVIGQADGTAVIFDTETLEPVCPPMAHSGPVSVVRFSPDGRSVLTCEVPPDPAPPAGARLWDAATGRPIGAQMIVEDDAIDAAFSPDGSIVATAGNDNAVTLWDAQTATRIAGPVRHDRSVDAIAFSPDGRTLASASRDGTARLWDARTLEPRARAMLHGSHVVALAFSPDSRRLATGSRDKAARIWDTATGLPLSEPFRHEGAVRSVNFDATGDRLLTVSEENAAHVWSVSTFPAPAPEWLISVAEILALESAPRSAEAAASVIAKYHTAVEQALATPPDSSFGRLALRLFGPTIAH